MPIDPSAARSGSVFSTNPSYLGSWVVYINGIEVPCIGWQVDYGIWKVPSATIYMFPEKVLERLGHEDRVQVAIFYLDHWAGPSEYRLLFDGEIIGWSYGNFGAQRTIGFDCLAHVQIFQQLYFFFMNSVDNFLAAGNPQIANSAITSAGFSYPYNLFHTGLITPPLSAGGTGQPTATPATGATSATTPTPASDPIARPFDFVYNVIAGLISDQVPPENRTAAMVNFFARWTRLTRFNNRWVALPLLEDTAVTSQGGGAFPIFKAARAAEALQMLQNHAAGRAAGAGPVWNTMQMVLTTVFMEIGMIPTAPCVKVNILTSEIIEPVLASDTLLEQFVDDDDPNPAPVPQGSIGSTTPVRLAQYFVKPQMYFGIAPSCNVIYPSMIVSYNYSENYSSQPTRVYVNDSLLTQALQARGNNAEFILQALSVGWPEEADKILRETKGTSITGQQQTTPQPNKSGKDILLYAEEIYKGPVIQRMQLPLWFQLLQQMRNSGGNAGTGATPTTPGTTPSPTPGTSPSPTPGTPTPPPAPSTTGTNPAPGTTNIPGTAPVSGITPSTTPSSGSGTTPSANITTPPVAPGSTQTIAPNPGGGTTTTTTTLPNSQPITFRTIPTGRPLTSQDILTHQYIRTWHLAHPIVWACGKLDDMNRWWFNTPNSPSHVFKNIIQKIAPQVFDFPPIAFCGFGANGGADDTTAFGDARNSYAIGWLGILAAEQNGFVILDYATLSKKAMTINLLHSLNINGPINLRGTMKQLLRNYPVQLCIGMTAMYEIWKNTIDTFKSIGPEKPGTGISRPQSRLRIERQLQEAKDALPNTTNPSRRTTLEGTIRRLQGILDQDDRSKIRVDIAPKGKGSTMWALGLLFLGWIDGVSRVARHFRRYCVELSQIPEEDRWDALLQILVEDGVSGRRGHAGTVANTTVHAANPYYSMTRALQKLEAARIMAIADGDTAAANFFLGKLPDRDKVYDQLTRLGYIVPYQKGLLAVRAAYTHDVPDSALRAAQLNPITVREVISTTNLGNLVRYNKSLQSTKPEGNDPNPVIIDETPVTTEIIKNIDFKIITNIQPSGVEGKNENSQPKTTPVNPPVETEKRRRVNNSSFLDAPFEIAQTEAELQAQNLTFTGTITGNIPGTNTPQTTTPQTISSTTSNTNVTTVVTTPTTTTVTTTPTTSSTTPSVGTGLGGALNVAGTSGVPITITPISSSIGTGLGGALNVAGTSGVPTTITPSGNTNPNVNTTTPSTTTTTTTPTAPSAPTPQGDTFADLFRNYAQYEFFRSRYEKRQAALQLAFNPYIVPGFSGVIFDKITTEHHCVGYITNVSHAATASAPNSASLGTTVQVSFCRTLNEFIANVANDAQRFGARVGSAPAEIIDEIRHVIQDFGQAEIFYKRLLYGNNNLGNQTASFNFLDALEYDNQGGTPVPIFLDAADLADAARIRQQAQTQLEDINNSTPQQTTITFTVNHNLDPNARLVPKTHSPYAKAFDSYDAAMKLASRPICTLTQYIRFWHGGKTITELENTHDIVRADDEFSYRSSHEEDIHSFQVQTSATTTGTATINSGGSNRSTSQYWKFIYRLKQGPGPVPPDTALRYSNVGPPEYYKAVDSLTSLPLSYEQTRVDWESALLFYRDIVRNRKAPRT